VALLEVRGLSVAFPGVDHRAVAGVDLDVDRGMILGLVGETGAGKTLTTRGILGVVSGATVDATHLTFDGIDLRAASPKLLRSIRGSRIGFVIQDARVGLNPLQPVGKSLMHILRTHERCSRREATDRIHAMLTEVGLSDVENVSKRLPHEFSGGMGQRVVIAAALLTNPELIIADEATTGLDLTVQARILDLLRAEIERRRAAAIVVTHDLGIVAQYCSHVAVMYAGKVRESGPVRQVFGAPAHPYTRNLLQAMRI
jgi:ABC-type dipeptide/oligopeptide/nickel transport system ATPase component